MTYRRYQKKIGLRTASLVTLREQITAAEAQITSLKLRVADAKIAKQILLRIEPLISETNDELSDLRSRYPKPRLFARLIGRSEQPAEVSRKIEWLEAKRNELESEQSEANRKASRLSDWLSSIDSKEVHLAKLHDAVARKQKKKNSIIELRAAAAANSEEARKVGSIVRRALTEQTICPYCGGSLGTTPHADHIYPISKGGRSVPENMVFTCSSCNGRKSDLTLSNFIRAFRLNRDDIEHRLEQLGKEF